MLHDLPVRWRRRLSLGLTVGILSVIGAAGFGGATPAYAIANGADADDGDYPFSVKLTMVDLPQAGGGTRDSSCSGGLINSRWVLTAGHCFKDAGGRRVAKPVAKRTVATIGRADLTGSAGQEAKVIAVRQSKVADVALAQLGRDGPVPVVAPKRAAAVAKAPAPRPPARPKAALRPAADELPYGLSLPLVIGASLVAVVAVFLIVTARSRRGRRQSRHRRAFRE